MLTLSGRRPISYRNQAGFHMITASVMTGLSFLFSDFPEDKFRFKKLFIFIRKTTVGIEQYIDFSTNNIDSFLIKTFLSSLHILFLNHSLADCSYPARSKETNKRIKQYGISGGQSYLYIDLHSFSFYNQTLNQRMMKIKTSILLSLLNQWMT